MPTHYEVLGIGPDADTEAIRRAYIAVAKASHPDRRQSDDPVRRARADDRIRAANAAWNVLRDPDRRAEYDLSLPSGPSWSGRPDGSTMSAGSARSAGPAGASSPGGRIPADRPTPPSGHVVPAAHASLWRYAPIVVVLTLLVGILVVSAYATAKDSGPPSDTLARVAAPAVDDCILVAFISNGKVPVPVTCGTRDSYRVQSWVNTPQACPPGSDALPLSDQKTTLCLVPAG